MVRSCARLRSRALRFAPLPLVLLLVPGCVDRPRPPREEEIARLEKYILDAPPKVIAHPLKLSFDDAVELLGYAIEPELALRPGTRVKLTMYWKLLKDLDEGWSLFTHVLDSTGKRLLNIDNIGPLREWRGSGQALPPGDWTVGKVYVDEQSFTIPVEARGERLEVVAGVWKGEARLKVVAGPHDAENRGKVATLALEERKKKKKKPSKPKEDPVPKLRVSKLPAGTKLKIDGVLDEAEWRRAATTRPFVNAQSGKRDKGTKLGGRVRLLYDDSSLYLGFDIQDPDIQGGFPKNAKDPHLWTADTVEIMIDPDGDGDNDDYYEIQINPQNLVFDSHFDRYKQPRGGPEGPFGNQDWSAELKSKVTVDGTLDKPGDEDKGYVVEAAIPWKAFHKAKQVPPKPGDAWRANFYAIEKNSGVAWSPLLGAGDFHRAARFGHLTWGEELVVRTREELTREHVRAPHGGAEGNPRTPGALPQRDPRQHRNVPVRPPLFPRLPAQPPAAPPDPPAATDEP